MDTLKFIVFTDLHVDIMFDSLKRIEAVMKAARDENAAFIINLGDITYPANDFLLKNDVELHKTMAFYCERDEEKHALIRSLGECEIPVYHVLGNHDSDACPKDVAMAYLGMESNYYSFEKSGYHFIVLDTNYIQKGQEYIPYEMRNRYGILDTSYPCVSEEQLIWLEQDIKGTDKPIIIFYHHPLWNHIGGIKNPERVRSILQNANSRVILCINGHTHLDGIHVRDGIPFWDVNSISCHWVGEEYTYARYSREIENAYPYLKYVTPYFDSVFAQVSLSPGRIQILGCNSEFVGPSPQELGLDARERQYPCSPGIIDRNLSY